MSQSNIKIVYLDLRAQKELNKLPRKVQIEFNRLVVVLEAKGRLTEPEGKKIDNRKNLFEMRVKIQGQWRGFYSYLPNGEIIILHFLKKKTQKTPLKNLELAIHRLINL